MISEEKLRLIHAELSQILKGQDIFIVLEALRQLTKALFDYPKKEASEATLEFLDSLYIKLYQRLKNYGEFDER